MSVFKTKILNVNYLIPGEISFFLSQKQYSPVPYSGSLVTTELNVVRSLSTGVYLIIHFA